MLVKTVDILSNLKMEKNVDSVSNILSLHYLLNYELCNGRCRIRWSDSRKILDGPIPGKYSMISFGAVLCRDPSEFVPEALAVSGFTREETLIFDDPKSVMKDFEKWLQDYFPTKKPFFISDNNGFDWQFINYYFHVFLGHNPFGHSSTNLGSFYKGVVKNFHRNFKHLRKTKHTHHPVDDARGNVEAFLQILEEYKVKK